MMMMMMMILRVLKNDQSSPHISSAVTKTQSSYTHVTSETILPL